MKFLRWVFLFSVCGTVPVLQARHAAAAGEVGYRGAIVIDADSGQVLFERNADEVSPPASMTKLMTFAVLHDKLAAGVITLQTPVQVTKEDASMGGTQVYLDARETFPVEELVYAMMIQSANDAAHALSHAAAGSTEAFVDLMNAKARALGMTNTIFRSPHGLPPSTRRQSDGDLTTPRDFAILCRYLVKNTDVLKYTSVKTRQFGLARPQGPIRMDNHNHLLGKVAGVDGLKTGYTASAGYCLSATAQRNGHRLIAVVMGSFGPNHTLDKGHLRDLRTIDLLESGFSALPAKAGQSNALTPAASAPADLGDPQTDDATPTVKTGAQGSTQSEPTVTFRVIPPH